MLHSQSVARTIQGPVFVLRQVAVGPSTVYTAVASSGDDSAKMAIK